jgi:hypothetical protein
MNNVSLSLSGGLPSFGRYSVWRQAYVGECDSTRDAPSEALASDVELVVRDFFQLEEVYIENLTVTLCYARETHAHGEVGVYTISVIIRGYPLDIPDVEQMPWDLVYPAWFTS